MNRVILSLSPPKGKGAGGYVLQLCDSYKNPMSSRYESAGGVVAVCTVFGRQRILVPVCSMVRSVTALRGTAWAPISAEHTLAPYRKIQTVAVRLCRDAVSIREDVTATNSSMEIPGKQEF